VPEFTDARAELAKIDEQWAKAPRERRKALNNKAAVAVCPLFVNATCADHSGQSDRGQLAAEYLTLVREGEKARRRTDKVTDVLQSVTLVLMLAAIAGLGIVVARIFGSRVVLVGGISLMAGFVLAALLAALMTKIGTGWSYFGIVMNVYPVATIVAWWFFLQDPLLTKGSSYAPTPLGALLVVGVTAGAFISVVFVLSALSTLVESVLVSFAVRGRRRSAAFHAVALAFMAMVQRGDNRKSMPAIGTLSRIAHHLWRMDSTPRLPDRDLRAVVADRFHQASNAVRAKKLSVALPTADTHAELRLFLVRLMRTLLDETYDDLPLAPPITPIVRRRAILSFFRTVIVGLLPAAALLTLHLLHVDLDKLVGANAAGSATTVAVGWAAVTLLLLLDPGLRERLATLKDVKGLFQRN
jgi:hypothetical protein